MPLHLLLIGAIIALVPLAYVWGNRSDNHKRDKYRKLVWITTFLVFDLILFGAFTRLTDSGLGCPDWPGCYGTATPFQAANDIHAAESALPAGPVTWFKAWVEMLHRYFAMAVGALVLALALLAWGRYRARQSPWPATGLLFLVCLQGAFGAWTVTLKLQPLIVTLHLMLGLSLFGALVWVAASASRQTWMFSTEWSGTTRLRPWVILGLALLTIQIALGGWVSSNYAVLACTDFPRCQGAWLPAMNFADAFAPWRGLGRTAAGGSLPFNALVAIHWTHRVAAVAVLAYLIWLGARARRVNDLRSLGHGLQGLVLLQLATGLSNILFSWPLVAALAHSGGAALLLLVLVVLLQRSSVGRH